MADKPSRSLVIYGDGQASLVSPSHSHIHSFASRASCGFLSLRDPHPAVPETENDRVIRELAQLLDAYDFYVSKSENPGISDVVYQKELSFPSISERFMGLRAAVITDCPKVRSFAGQLGFSVLQLDELIKQTGGQILQDSLDDRVVSEVLRLLGFSGGDVLDKYEYDLVFLHLMTTEKCQEKKIKMDLSSVEWLNRLVGRIMETAHSGSSIACRVHFSIVLSYDTAEDVDQYSLVPNSTKETNSDLCLLRPRQSYTMKGGKVLNDIRHHHPMLLAQWQEGVTRKDMAKAFSFQEFSEHGGNLAILADRFIHEVAFKLWKAPKYGA